MNAMPELLAKVLLRKRSEVYLVVDLDPARRVVEVISVTGEEQHLIPDVPVRAIREVVEEPPDYL
jgi:hypothetical protein